jgi:AAA domain
MSSTRKALPGSGFRQERFASSPEFQVGLMANLVARRCQLLERAEDRRLIWFLQLLSHREGGLKEVARDLVASFPEGNATHSMRKFGMKPGQVYTASQVKAIRKEIPLGDEDFPLRGEMTGAEVMGLPDIPNKWDDLLGIRREEALRCLGVAESRAKGRPETYKAEGFCQACRIAADGLPDYLAELCLNPSLRLDKGGPWYFPALIDTLREFQAAWIERHRRAGVFTELGKQVCETLDYSREEHCLTLVDGLARTGKTHAAKAWCEMNPGVARYVQVPSTNDEIGFYRAIAKSLGVSINLNSKAQELRQRIEDTLQPGGLTVVFDEAHWLWPSSTYRDALPGRINWIMTALVNYGVPVGLVTTPQFMRAQKRVESKACWTSEQFVGRIGHYQKLPNSLSEKDLSAVAKVLLPEGDSTSIEMLVAYAQASAKYLAAIEIATHRARFLAKRDGRVEACRQDVKRAITESVIPSDSALAEALSGPVRQSRRASKPVPEATQEPAAAPRGIAPRVVEPVTLETDRVRQTALVPC